MSAFPRERFSSAVALTPAAVSAYAAGDDNPVHHDPQFAASTRYRRVIASGTRDRRGHGAMTGIVIQRCVRVK